MDALEQYRQLRQATTAQCSSLEQLHCTHLACKPGCHQCCANLSVFPVEFYAILDDLRGRGVTELTLDPSASCAFLSEGLCIIYALRPMICRTHGLPIAFLNEDSEEPEMNVSFCPLNFTLADEDELSFGPDSTVDIDQLNTQLAHINQQFLHKHPELNLAPTQRIALSDLAEHLRK